MARKSTFVPSTTAGTLIPMDEIPQDVIDDVEEAYKLLQGADGRIHVVFDTAEEKAAFSRQATSYAAQTTPKLKFRWSPTKGGQKDTEGDFRVTRDLEGNGKDREVTDGGKGK